MATQQQQREDEIVGMGNDGVVDGSSIKALVEDKTAFARFVDGKFSALDASHTGDLTPQELKPAVLGIGGALGLPPQGSSPDTDPIYDQVMESFLDGRAKKVSKEKFAVVLREILLGLADGLEREPINIMSLDGSKLREYARHPDAEISAVNAFVENDLESTGKVKASVLRDALKRLSVDHGAPPYGEASLPVVDAALSRSGVNEDALIDQNEYVALFKKVLLEMSTIMSEKPLTVAHVRKKFDGQSVKAFLSDKKASKKVISEAWKTLPKEKNGSIKKDDFIFGLDFVSPRAGLPPLGAIEEMDSEIIGALKMMDNGGAASHKNHHENLIDREMFEQYLRQVLGSMMLQLEGKPIVIQSSAIVSGAQAGNPAAIF
ncbi:hypothetical protein SELMODRAFT_271381 [Selaginella moellendorffii]|uniref:EF-hand domain-containing protein n=1 Tax=Selaginella moellendorffii TaxID=88036 RepID=D8S7Z2_SELML|nr:uncharacterized protein LOC9634779 [Selaginella moellendorffii]EFJ19433.1 hypothetical protein SELMODRAFT_271381 [Selaginella moellendorffii]|eukprot:XP_002979544.1 uncharacterized protein LOC9634779 [Selaginella moellendorffii]